MAHWRGMFLAFCSVAVLASALTAGEPSDAELWSFQPPVASAVPSVQDTNWPAAQLDHFILAALESKGLRAAPRADRRTLIRRATFDLIGVPPSPAEIDAFLADGAPGALARVVERLLASPHYGERWGRHWLDVVRYADSNGLDENVAHGNAWRYRDYVVKAFNDDKPYDRFLLEQLAGDLLAPGDNPAARRELLIATGFLSLGPKVLAEVDEKKMEMDIVDEQISTVGQALMGLTLGCARCHDHKFDPLTMDDYYALAGVFKSTRTMENFTKVARWYENSLATEEQVARKAEYDKQVAELKKSIEGLVAQATKQLKEQSEDGKLPDKPEASFSEKTKAELKRLRDELAAVEAQPPVLPTAMGVTEGTVADAHLHLRGSPQNLGELVARHVPAVLADADAPKLDGKQSGRLQLAHWLADPEHPLTARVMVNRIWRWHFGQGLVASPDNFGKLGQRPVNQPLLDWLAVQFVNSGWSVKAMHRLIMLSSTYQMSSAYNAAAAGVDPENRLQWRAGVRRLEAEPIRDAMLAVSGLLDRTVGGSLLPVANRAYFFDHTSRDLTRYDSPRRSIYLPVVRNHLYDEFQLFDYSDASVPNGNRSTTTVAPQALFLMNSDFVFTVTGALAKSLLADATLNDPARVTRLYLKAYGRPPTDQEVARAQSFIADFESDLRANNVEADAHLQSWQALCQVIFASNEFVYVR